MSAQKPLIILVPGAWHLPSCFNKLEKCLTEAGYAVEKVRTPSVGADPPLPDTSADVAEIRKALTAAVDAGSDIILALHSYGGVPGSEAAQGFGKEQRAAEGKAGGIVNIVYITAFACAEGQNLLDARMHEPSTWLDIRENGHVYSTNGEYIFYNDVHPTVAQENVAELQAHSVATFVTPVTYAAWKHIPSTYILCTIDNCTWPHIQERMVAQEGGKWTSIVRIRSGHSPFLSMPEETARILRRAAGETGDAVRLQFEDFGETRMV